MSYWLQQALLAQTIIAYFTDPNEIREIPRGFWRDNTGNDAIWSGMTPASLSSEPEWIYLKRPQYEEFLSKLGISDAAGSDLPGADSPQSASLKRRPMTMPDIAKAAGLLLEETLIKRMTRDQQRLWLRQTFAEKDITEDNFRSIFKDVPVKIGRPKKTDR